MGAVVSDFSRIVIIASRQGHKEAEVYWTF